MSRDETMFSMKSIDFLKFGAVTEPEPSTRKVKSMAPDLQISLTGFGVSQIVFVTYRKVSEAR